MTQWSARCVVLLGLAACAGCGSDANPVAPTPVVLPLDVRITTIWQTLDGGGTLQLRAGVTGAKAQGPLTYRWSGTGGSFVDNAVKNATWLVPMAQPSVRNYTLQLTVTDTDSAMATDTVFFTVRAAWPVRPIDLEFNDTFWTQLVYGQHDDPGDLMSRTSWVLDSPSRMNIYLRTTNWPHHRLRLDEWLAWMEDAWPVLVERMTGAPWRGRFETGSERANQLDWITIRLIDPAKEYPDDWGRACGRARLGSNPGQIWLDETNPNCMRESYFPALLSHELGHSYGFWHVPDPHAVMSSRGNRVLRLTPAEQYHAQLAYDVGPGQPYCGWPYGATCPPRRLLLPPKPSPPIVVVD